MLEQIWEKRILTNNGPFHQELEARLSELFDSPFVSVTNNGMQALEIAVEAADLTGDVITTPYSFVATTHALTRHGLNPIFADVRESDLNIDPDAIEAAITPDTSAIVGVHVYGNPCAVERIDEIAARHGLRVIYDAAHAFGVRLGDRSLLSYGDYAALSFHATKAFNTLEGGAIVTNTERAKRRVDGVRNFGIADEVTIPMVGTNAKMNEVCAALGLLQIDHFEEVRRRRGEVDARYRQAFSAIPGLRLIAVPEHTIPNYSYFPILVGEGSPIGRDALYEALKRQDIYSRRYFYPLLSTLPMYAQLPSAAPGRMPVAERAAQEVLCLPIYPDLAAHEQQRIIEAIVALVAA